MWAPVGVSMSATLSSKQTSSCPGLTVIVAVPLPSGSPWLGTPSLFTSASPVNTVEKERPPWSATSSLAADAAPASAKATSAAKANDNNSRLLFICPPPSLRHLNLANRILEYYLVSPAIGPGRLPLWKDLHIVSTKVSIYIILILHKHQLRRLLALIHPSAWKIRVLR